MGRELHREGTIQREETKREGTRKRIKSRRHIYKERGGGHGRKRDIHQEETINYLKIYIYIYKQEDYVEKRIFRYKRREYIRIKSGNNME